MWSDGFGPWIGPLRISTGEEWSPAPRAGRRLFVRAVAHPRIETGHLALGQVGLTHKETGRAGKARPV